MFNPLVDSGYFMAKGVDVIDPEIALVYGPFSVQGEYICAQADDVVMHPQRTSSRANGTQ